MKKNVLPLPSSLSAPIVPPISSTSRRAIARPSPLPPYLRVIEESAWVKVWKIESSFSGAIPIPVSRTEKRSSRSPCPSSPAFSIVTATSPRCVNLIALPTRLISTWRSLSASPTSRVGTSGSIRVVSSSFFSLARTLRVSIERPTKSSRSNSFSSRCSLPLSTLARSRIPLIRSSNALLLLIMVLT